MVEFYFYLDKGKAKGPLKKKEVLQFFDEGRLGALDLIYKEGSEKWIPAFEVSEFQDLFKDTPKKSFLETPRREWILLQKKRPEEGKGFRQTGPYSEEEVKTKIHSGVVTYQDYAWRNGFEEWTKIRDIETFSKKQKVPDLPKILPEETVPESIKKPASHKPIEKKDIFIPKPAKAEAPPEAKGSDLTRPWESGVEISIIEESEQKARVEVRRSPVKSSGTENAPEVEKKNSESTRSDLKEEAIAIVITQQTPQRWLSRLIFVGFVVGLVSFVILMAANPHDYKWPAVMQERFPGLVSWLSRTNSPEEIATVSDAAKSSPAPSATAPVALPAKAPEPAPVVKPVAVEPKNPTRLAATLTEGNILEIQTDGTNHFPIKVRLFGQAGKVLAETGVYREATLTWMGSETPRWQLGPLGLFKGDYLLMLSQDNLVKYQNLRLEDASGRARLSANEARKWQAPGFNEERRDLATLSKEMIEQAQKLEQSYVRLQSNPASWASFFKTWQQKRRSLETTKEFSAGLRGRALPWHWYRLKDAAAKMNEKAQAYDRSIKAKSELKREIAEADIVKNFTELRKEVLALRLYQ